MKVLFFEVTIPKRYLSHSFHGAGWQDSLEELIVSNTEIELAIAFECNDKSLKPKVIDGIQYFPIHVDYNLIEKIQDKWSWSTSREKIIPLSLRIIEEFKPDIIQVFGSEWCFGQVAEYTKIPVIIHMQGSIPPYNNANYPPGYNELTELWFHFIKFQWNKLFLLPIKWHKQKTWRLQEERTLKTVKYFMGRTHWDKAITQLYNPASHYFYCNEALRAEFINETRVWQPQNESKIRLITTGCSTYWKGLDTIVRTAKLLKERNVNFEWVLAGSVGNKSLIEWKEKSTMESINIKPIGMLNSKQLIEELLQSDLYVHTAYIDNSPNSICEAQILGLPIISTNVGGIASLIDNGKDGILVPANDPYILANHIIHFVNNKKDLITMSNLARQNALLRHNPKEIISKLISIYIKIENNEVLK